MNDSVSTAALDEWMRSFARVVAENKEALTDLDAGHYEQIPLNQIDLAATARANHASGMEFRIPGASRD